MLRRLVAGSMVCGASVASVNTTTATLFTSSAFISQNAVVTNSAATAITVAGKNTQNTWYASMNRHKQNELKCCYFSTCLHVANRCQSGNAVSESSEEFTLHTANSMEKNAKSKRLSRSKKRALKAEGVNTSNVNLNNVNDYNAKSITNESTSSFSDAHEGEVNLVEPSEFVKDALPRNATNNNDNELHHKNQPIVSTNRIIIPPIPSLTSEEIALLHSASDVALHKRKSSKPRTPRVNKHTTPNNAEQITFSGLVQESKAKDDNDNNNDNIALPMSDSNDFTTTTTTTTTSNVNSEGGVAIVPKVKTLQTRKSRSKRHLSSQAKDNLVNDRSTSTKLIMKADHDSINNNNNNNASTDLIENNTMLQQRELEELEEEQEEVTTASSEKTNKSVIQTATSEAFNIDDIPDVLSDEESTHQLHNASTKMLIPDEEVDSMSSEGQTLRNVASESPLTTTINANNTLAKHIQSTRRKRPSRSIEAVSHRNNVSESETDPHTLIELPESERANQENNRATADVELSQRKRQNKEKEQYKLSKVNARIEEDHNNNDYNNNTNNNNNMEVEVDKTNGVCVDNKEVNQEEYFAELMHKMKLEEEERNMNRLHSTSLEENTLVYNALTGRMTGEMSVTMQSLMAIGFGINSERHLHVVRPEVLNSYAANVRGNRLAISPKWPSTLRKVLGGVLHNDNISNPAEAIEQLIQVKINSMLRSRYASVVSAEVNTVGNDDNNNGLSPSSSSSSSSSSSELETSLESHSDGNITLNKEQEHVIKIALQGHHMYIGGSAGTGKTVLLRVLCKRLQAHRLRVAMTATTGVAGCHISGSTFHHAFGVTSRGEFLRRNSLLEYDVIIIDEVSMFSQRLFEDFDRVLREEAGTPDVPFGGIQIILCGDFLQLGCINESSLIHSQLFHANFVKLRLHTQVRQTANSKFARDLQEMRLGHVPSDLTETVQQLPPGTMVESAVNLLPTNKEVHAANEAELQRLTGDPLTLLPETGITSLKCDSTATLLLRTCSQFNVQEFARHVRALLQATLDLPHASLLSLYKLYEDGHAMRVILPPSESLAWRDGMRERFLEIAGLINDLDLGATVTEIVPKGDGLHTPETEEYLQKLMSKHPVAQPLTFKKGCRVLLRANLTSNLVNGSIGTVVDFVECKTENFPKYLRSERVDECIERFRVFCVTECGMPVALVPVVKFHSGEQVAVPPWEFTVGGTGNTQYYSLSCVALPLSLAYAFTVHKVQGLTLVGRVHLELSRMWPCDHLLYVAMSRVRNPEQLSMSSFAPKMVVANAECVTFDQQLKGSHELDNITLSQYPIASWKKCNDTIYFLRRKGSSLRKLLEEVTRSGSVMHQAQRNNFSSSYNTSSATANLFQSAYINKAGQAYYSTHANNQNYSKQQALESEEGDKEEEEEEEEEEQEEEEGQLQMSTKNDSSNSNNLNKKKKKRTSRLASSLTSNDQRVANINNNFNMRQSQNNTYGLLVNNNNGIISNSNSNRVDEGIPMNSRDVALRKLAEMGINVDHILTVQRSSARWRQLRNLVKHATRVERFKEARRRAKSMAPNNARQGGNVNEMSFVVESSLNHDSNNNNDVKKMMNDQPQELALVLES